MKIRRTKRSFTIIEVLIVLVFFPILFGVSGYLYVTSLKVMNNNIGHAGIREDMTVAMEKTVQDLKTTAQGGLGQYSSIAHTVEYTDVDGGEYVFYLYNSDDATLDSTYGEDYYDLRRANTVGGWTEITNDTFESGFGNWTDGGVDCIRYTGGAYAHEGSAAINLQDNTNTSVMSTGDLALSGYSEVRVEFWYYVNDFNGTEDFWLQISTNGGSGYTTVQSWVRGTDFSNGNFYEESVDITGYTLTDTTRIRFRADASDNADDVYIDEVVVSASTGAAEVPASGEGKLILRDLVSPDATEPATDITISGNEVTLDLVVERDDEIMTMRTKVRPRNL